jgi:hypothetical protein
MIPRVFGRVLSVTEFSAGDVLAVAATATDTTLFLDDVTDFGEEPGQAILVSEDGDSTEIVDVLEVDPETDTLIIDGGLASSWDVDTTIFVFPYITTRYAFVTSSGAEDDTIQAIVPTQIGRFLTLGSREDSDQERVTLEWEAESGSWVVRDIYTSDPDNDPVEVSLGDLLDVDPAGALDGQTIKYDEDSGLWLPADDIASGDIASGDLLAIEDDAVFVALADTIDFGSNLDVTDDGMGHVTVDATGGGSDGSDHDILDHADANTTPSPSTDDVLTWDGSEWIAAAPSGGSNPWTEITKTADEDVTSSITIQDDNELTFAVTANSVYVVEMYLIYANTGGAVPDFKYKLAVPAGTTGLLHHYGLTTGNSALNLVTDLTSTNAVGAGTDRRMVHTVASIFTAGTSGNVTLQWAQAQSDITPTRLYANSRLRYRKLDP